jgi:hypothetical protein
VANLNAQIPKYDKVVAITNELRVAQGEVTQLSAKAVDWSAVVTQLGQRIPAGLSIITFTGTSAATTGAPVASTASTGVSAAGPAPAGSIGSLTLGVSGTFPSSAHFDPVAQWIDSLTASPMFSPPGVAAVTNAPTGASTTVAFQSTLFLTSSSNLTKNAGS